MIVNEVKKMDFSDARYLILKSLDTRDAIGSLLIKYSPQLLNIVGKVCNSLEEVMMAGEGGNSLFEIPDDSELRAIIQTTREMPCLMLQDVSCPLWSDFLSAWICLIENFGGAMLQKVDGIEGPHEDQIRATVGDMFQALTSIERLITCGNSYMDLIQATNSLLNEIKSWNNSRPTSLRLSEAYLQALDFYKEK